MSDYKIEKGIPVPVMGRLKYPLADMMVGDSILVPIGDGQSLRNCASVHGKNSDRKFSVHKVDGGFRCWRTA